MTNDRPTCPDRGTCHHQCPPSACFRVRTCGPLSNVFPGDAWPEEVRREHLAPCGASDPGLHGWSCTMVAGHEPVIPRDPWNPAERYEHHDGAHHAYWGRKVVGEIAKSPLPEPDITVGVRVEHLTASLDFVREDTAIVLEVRGTAVRILGTREELAGLVADLDSLIAGLDD